MSNKSVVPEAKESMNRFKMEAANEVGVNLKQGYNGDLTSKEAGSIGGQMVKRMIESYEQSMKYSSNTNPLKNGKRESGQPFSGCPLFFSFLGPSGARL